MIFSNMTEVVLITDQSGLLLFISPNIERIIGYSQGEIQERFETITQLLGENLLQHQELEAQQEILNIERRIIDKSGQHHILSIDVKQVEIGKGKIFYACRDITSEKPTEICLKQWDKQKKSTSDHSLLNSKAQCQNSPGKADVNDGGKSQLLSFELDGLNSHKTEETHPHLEEETCQCHSLKPLFNHKPQKSDCSTVAIPSESVPQSTIEHFFTLALEMFCIAGFDGCFKRLNPAWEKTLGFTQDELLAIPYLDFVHPEDHEATLIEAQKLVTGANSVEFENRYRCQDGSYKWLLWKATPFAEQQLIYAVARDITHYKQAEEELKRTQARLQYLLAHTPAAIYSCQPSGDYRATFMSENTVLVAGYEAQEFFQNNSLWLDNIHPEDMDSILTGLTPLFERGHHVHEYRFRHKDGRYRWIRDELKLVRDENGNPLEIVGYWSDISNRKLTETALRQSEKRYRRMIETTLEGVWMIDESNQTTLVNQRMASMLGYTIEEMMGKEVFEFMDENTQTIAQQYVARRRLGISEQYDLKLRHRKGSEVWVIVSTTPIYSTQGQYIGALKMLTDITQRKQAEKALQEQEAILRSFYDSSPLMMGVVELLDDDVLHLSDNQTTAQFFGTTPDAMRNQLASHLGAPLTHIQQWIEHYKKSESTATPVRFEYQHCTATESKWLSATVCFIGKMLNGRSRFSYIVEDITERKQSEETLRQQLAAVEAAMDGIAILNPQQEFIYLNQAHVKLFGYNNSTELLGKTWHGLYSPEQIQGFNHDIFPILSQTGQWHGEAIAKKQDGSTFFEEVSLTLTQDGGLICVCRDITQRKQSEEQLRWEEALMRSMTEASPLAFYVVDNRTDSILYFNPRFCEIWGIEHLEQSMQRGELKNNDIIPACIPLLADIVAFAESCKPLQTEENRVVIEDEIPFVDGRTIRRFSAQVRDESDRYFGRLYVFEDVTERKQAEAMLKAISQREHEKATQLELTLKELQHTQAQLVQKEKMASLGQLVAGVAHEINNPVSFIYGNLFPAREYAQDLLELVKLYQRYYPEPVPEILEQIEQIEPDYIAEDFPQLLNSMQDGAERITQIVLSLRNFSRLDEKELKWVDIHEGIDSTLLILQHRLKQQPHRAEIQVIKQYGNLPRIECYSSQLNQVFMNILSNAIDALEMRHEEGGEYEPMAGSYTQDATLMIWIGTEDVESNRVIIHITDNGSGITPDAQERLFDPFFTTKPPGKGTGLGLSISYQIVVERHRGKLWCHSTPDHGTEFTIELPITAS
jgi:PAS domain S-box-containing protein